MANFMLNFIAVLYIILTKVIVSSSDRHEPRKPNVVLFIVDDMGIGDVGCFGNDTIRTPNIDRIARDGAILTHHLAADAVCTPSRAAFLTGRFPIRSGMASQPHNVPIIPFLASSGGLPVEETTLAELAKNSGYTTALFGKWHQGLNCNTSNDFCHHPLSHGFDNFYGCPETFFSDFGPEGGGLTGYSCFRNWRTLVLILIRNTSMVAFFISIFIFKKNLLNLKTVLFINMIWLTPLLMALWTICNVKMINGVLMRNLDVVEQPIRLENLTQRIVSESISFAEDSASKEMPFLMVVSWFQVHVVLHTSSDFSGISKHGKYGDNVEEMDWGTGEILRALERIKQLGNTFVYLTSDNGGQSDKTGPGGGCHGGHNGIFRGAKGQSMMDGGIRVPAVAMWKNHIKPGTIIDLPTSMMDIFPTLRDSILNTPRGESHEIIIDGKNIYPILAGLNGEPPHRVLLHYSCEQILSARYTPKVGKDVYKVYYATPDWIEGTYTCDKNPICGCDSLIRHEPPLIYNIGRDPSEEGPIPSSDPAFNETLHEVDVALREHISSLSKNGGKRDKQMTYYKLFPRPWLQLCCNFPWCKCIDPAYPDLKDF